ncbi:DNA-binding protein [Alteromonas facilis]|uniref:DNA-binding protein n=1 Tax=Alteromonas facilis TaxID=2048004 RepID=UPI000C285D57|nr:DNA-binding protein [Alteromonas facilis]
MARHAEVSEKSIIQAGMELEAIGKRPNPGAIRAHLGYRGGLLRIKSVWETFDSKRHQQLLPTKTQELTFDSLPDDYAKNASHLMERVTDAIEQLTIEAYMHSQAIQEKRALAIEKSYRDKIEKYTEAELDADKSINALEQDVDELQNELRVLAEQNAKLLVENAELKGRLSVFSAIDSKPQTKTNAQK